MGDVAPNGHATFWLKENQKSIETLQIDVAYLFWESRLQMGLSLPLERSEIAQSEWSLKRLSIVGGYEFLPERTFSYWKPRGLVFLQMGAPLSDQGSKSWLDEPPWTLSSGLLFLKVLGPWDGQFLVKINHSLEYTTLSHSETRTKRPGIGLQGLVSGGYSVPKTGVRMGMGISPVFNDTGMDSGSGRTASSLVWNTNFTLSYLFSPEFLMATTYTDPTLMGPARTTFLTQSFSLLLQRRWNL